jgi:Helix-turn-helix domain
MSEQYVSAAQAARILGVSRQRVSQLVTRGDILSVKPWPGAVRIPMTAITDWQEGRRRPATTKTAAIDYVLSQQGEMPVYDTLAAYITGARPEWDDDRQIAWVDEMLPAAERAAGMVS